MQQLIHSTLNMNFILKPELYLCYFNTNISTPYLLYRT